jgi:hypothetical protein
MPTENECFLSELDLEYIALGEGYWVPAVAVVPTWACSERASNCAPGGASG